MLIPVVNMMKIPIRIVMVTVYVVMLKKRILRFVLIAIVNVGSHNDGFCLCCVLC
jgi:hypothetical protein